MPAFQLIMERSQLVQITRRSKIAENDFAPMINAIYEHVWQNLFPPQLLTDNLSIKVAKNVVTPPDTPIPDCLTCGACCGALPYVGVRPDERVAAEDFWDVVSESDEEIVIDRFVRRNSENFACIALDGNIGEKVSCRIYENRPRMCHLFEAGSDKCHAIRRAFGFEPFLSIEEMFESMNKIDAVIAAGTKDPETIVNVKFLVQTETGNIEIKVSLKDNSIRIIHIFDPSLETWRQFEFDGLTLEQAKQLIASRSNLTQ